MLENEDTKTGDSISSAVCIPFILFSCLIALANTSSTKLEGKVSRTILALYLSLVENLEYVTTKPSSLLTVGLVGLFVYLFIYLFYYFY